MPAQPVVTPDFMRWLWSHRSEIGQRCLPNVRYVGGFCQPGIANVWYVSAFHMQSSCVHVVEATPLAVPCPDGIMGTRCNQGNVVHCACCACWLMQGILLSCTAWHMISLMHIYHPWWVQFVQVVRICDILVSFLSSAEGSQDVSTVWHVMLHG